MKIRWKASPWFVATGYDLSSESRPGALTVRDAIEKGQIFTLGSRLFGSWVWHVFSQTVHGSTISPNLKHPPQTPQLFVIMH